MQFKVTNSKRQWKIMKQKNSLTTIFSKFNTYIIFNQNLQIMCGSRGKMITCKLKKEDFGTINFFFLFP